MVMDVAEPLTGQQIKDDPQSLLVPLQLSPGDSSPSRFENWLNFPDIFCLF